MLQRLELIKPIRSESVGSVKTFHRFEDGSVAESLRFGKRSLGIRAVRLSTGETVFPPVEPPRVVRGPSREAIIAYLRSFSSH